MKRRSTTTRNDLLFGTIGFLVFLTHLILLLTGKPQFVAFLIEAAMTASFWWFSRKGRFIAACFAAAVIILSLLATIFDLWQRSLAGVTYDTYMHLLAAFALTLLATAYFEQQRLKFPLLTAVALVAALSVGVEAAELLEQLAFHGTLFTPDCLNSVCWYWQDTVKDLLNDGLGALLALAAR